MRLWIPLSIALAFALSTPAGAGNNAGKAHKKAAHGQECEGKTASDRLFSSLEKTIVRDYFGGEPEQSAKPKRSKSLPPGLAKRQSLPPGLAKRDRLPPGLAKREIPADLARRLGLPAQGTERVLVGGDLVLLETATGLILDVLRGVL